MRVEIITIDLSIDTAVIETKQIENFERIK